MDDVELKKRTKQFALRVMKLVGALPVNFVGKSIGSQPCAVQVLWGPIIGLRAEEGRRPSSSQSCRSLSKRLTNLAIGLS